MPIPLNFKNGNSDTTVILFNNQDNQDFEFTLPFAADTLKFDPEIWLVSKGNSVIRLSAFNFSVNIYPNPVSDVLQMRIETAETRNAAIKITNELGQIVWSDTQQFNSGSSTISIDTKQLLAGVYHVSFEVAGKLITSSFVKTNR